MDYQEILGSECTCEGTVERETVRRILSAAGLKSSDANDFAGLQALGFPFLMIAHKFQKRDLDSIDVDMRKRPSKAALMIVYEEMIEQLQSDTCRPADIALVFNWPGHGGLHVLTHDLLMPYRLGSYGQYWHIGGRYYLLEPLGSFAERHDAFENW